MKTSITLLRRLRSADDSKAWNRFVKVYSLFINSQLRKWGVAASDIDDVRQEVFAALAREINNFQHNGNVGAFRRWLKLMAVNRCRQYFTGRKKNPRVGSDTVHEQLNQLSDPNSDLSRVWNEEHNRHLVHSILNSIRSDFSERTMEIFERSSLGSESAADLATELNLPRTRIYQARNRVKERLISECRNLIDSVVTHAPFVKELP